MDEEYKSLLVKNESESKLALYIYSAYDPICWLSYEKKHINPNDKYLYRSTSCFKYELQALEDKNKKQIKRAILDVEKWENDTYIKVDDSFNIERSLLSEQHQDWTICTRRLNKDSEVASGSGRNLYEILRLDPKVIRKLPLDEQTEKIKEASKRELLRWHPNKNPDDGDNHMVREVLLAREQLEDSGKRACHNNEMDHNQGWLSISCWKSIFWPNCNTDEQIMAYRKRMFQTAISKLAFVVGTAIIFGTAGLASPAAVILGSVAGGSIQGAGMLTTWRMIRKDAIVNGCSWKKYLLTGGIGMVAGAFGGGAAVTIRASVSGIGAAASSTCISTVEKIAVGASGAIGAASYAVGNDAVKKFVDGEEVSVEDSLKHAMKSAATGAVLGVRALASQTSQVQGIEEEDNECNNRKLRPVTRLKNNIGESNKHFLLDENNLVWVHDGRIRCISEGPWASRMKVKYIIGDTAETVTVSGNGESVTLPQNAVDIEVSFQILRFIGVWCDVKKWNRKAKIWHDKAHILCYKTAVTRTITIAGSLYYEGITKVTNDLYDEVDDI